MNITCTALPFPSPIPSPFPYFRYSILSIPLRPRNDLLRILRLLFLPSLIVWRAPSLRPESEPALCLASSFVKEASLFVVVAGRRLLLFLFRSRTYPSSALRIQESRFGTRSRAKKLEKRYCAPCQKKEKGKGKVWAVWRCALLSLKSRYLRFFFLLL